MQKLDKQGKSKAVVGFVERMNTSATAKQLLLEKLRANKIDVNAPAFLERQTARRAAAEAQTERDIQRKVAKDAAKAKAIADRKAERIRAEALVATELANRLATEAEAAAALIALHEQRKAARDARYAARKARQ